MKRSAANFNAEELPLATLIFKGIDYTRQKGPPESLRVGPELNSISHYSTDMLNLIHRLTLNFITT